jgi:hypothetical protein
VILSNLTVSFFPFLFCTTIVNDLRSCLDYVSYRKKWLMLFGATTFSFY